MYKVGNNILSIGGKALEFVKKVPSVSAVVVTNISMNSAVLTSSVTNDNGSGITERGFVYSTGSTPTILNAKIIVSGTTGVFSTTATGLTIDTTYYVRAYAVNSIGITYGVENSFLVLGYFYADFFERVEVGADWNTTELLSATIIENNLVTLAKPNTWLQLKGAYHVFSSNLTGDFSLEAPFSYVRYPMEGNGSLGRIMVQLVNTVTSVSMNFGLQDNGELRQPFLTCFDGASTVYNTGEDYPDVGTINLKLTRISGIYRFYNGEVLIWTSPLNNGNNYNVVKLINENFQEYPGYKASWDYLKIQQL